MVLTELKEALVLLRRIPVLWVPGLVTGLIAAMLWLAYNSQGTFFATRLVLIGLLIAVFFLAGSYAVIRDGNGSIRELFLGGIQYFFRILLPLMVICFCTVILVALVMITLSFGGVPADPEFLGAFSICLFIPVAFLTLFFDTAAVFENRQIFDAIRRSIEVVTVQSFQILKFYVISAAVFFAITFSLMIVWEAALYEKLEPLTRFNETQIAAFTPEQLTGMIGADGIIVTAICLFFGFLVLMPILSAYKACFFRSVSKNSVPHEQPITGEFDSKGRWYKY
ncbi:MAG: hypothetical protein Q7T80_04970 [Methanoregula sp.]|nr:hypothetical protein [Methanoregula sp.]